jgi:hypothetical protein
VSFNPRTPSTNVPVASATIKPSASQSDELIVAVGDNPRIRDPTTNTPRQRRLILPPVGDGPGLLDIRSQGYGEDPDWHGLTDEDVFEDENTAFVWSKWEPLELWAN